MDLVGLSPTNVPRIGFIFRLNKALKQVEWYRRGSDESYPDKKASQRKGIWEKSVDAMQTPYEAPQENGNRTRMIGIHAERVDGERYFDFAPSHHSAETVQAAKHPTDLVQENATLLRLDAKVASVGTAACGPEVRGDFLVKCVEISFGFELKPMGFSCLEKNRFNPFLLAGEKHAVFVICIYIYVAQNTEYLNLVPIQKHLACLMRRLFLKYLTR